MKSAFAETRRVFVCVCGESSDTVAQITPLDLEDEREGEGARKERWW